MAANKHIENKLREELKLKFDTSGPGWEARLVGQLSQEQLVLMLKHFRHQEDLLELALEKLLRETLDAAGLLAVVIVANQATRLKAAQRMLKREATAEQLADLIIYCQDRAVRRRAAAQLLERNPINHHLVAVIVDVPDPKLAAAAVARWDRQAHPRDVVHVLRYGKDDAIAQIFWDLLVQHPERTQSDISYVMNFTEVPAIRNQAAAVLIEDPSLSLDRLSYVASKCTDEAVTLRACERILELKATNSDHLLSVIERHPSQEVRTRVAQGLLRLKPTSKHFKPLGADTIYAHMLCSCTDEGVCAAAWERFRAIEPVSTTFVEFIAKKACQVQQREAAAHWLSSLKA